MTAIPIYRKDGSQNGTAELNPTVFEAPVNQRLLDLVLKAYAGNQRRGTHDTKGRAQVRGGGKKPWRQKGTGRARQGSRRAPQWRGGGTVFGPHPRDYDTDLPEQMRSKALVSVLSLKNKEGNLLLVEDAVLKEPKTKELVGVMKALGLGRSRTLFVVETMDEKLKRASRNVQEWCAVRRACDVNAYHIQRRKKLLIDRQAISTLERRALGEGSKIPESQGASV